MSIFKKKEKKEKKYHASCDGCSAKMEFDSYLDINMNEMGAVFCNNSCREKWRKEYIRCKTGDLLMKTA